MSQLYQTCYSLIVIIQSDSLYRTKDFVYLVNISIKFSNAAVVWMWGLFLFMLCFDVFWSGVGLRCVIAFKLILSQFSPSLLALVPVICARVCTNYSIYIYKKLLKRNETSIVLGLIIFFNEVHTCPKFWSQFASKLAQWERSVFCNQLESGIFR